MLLVLFIFYLLSDVVKDAVSRLDQTVVQNLIILVNQWHASQFTASFGYTLHESADKEGVLGILDSFGIEQW